MSARNASPCRAIRSARRGSGAFVDGERVTTRATGQTPPIAAISLVFADPTRREAICRHIAPHYTLVDIPRCAAEQYPRLALGTNDVSLFERTLAWDHAAGCLWLVRHYEMLEHALDAAGEILSDDADVINRSCGWDESDLSARDLD